MDEFCCYHPQTKFAKVMFTQVSVCPRGGGSRSLSRRGQLRPGVCVQAVLCPGGSRSNEVSVQGGLCRGGGGCVQGVLCLGGLCPGGSLSRILTNRPRPPYSNEMVVGILLECSRSLLKLEVTKSWYFCLPLLSLYFHC